MINRAKVNASRPVYGFTLFELVVFILIAGLLLTMLVSFTKIYLKQEQRNANEEAIRDIQTALDQFYGLTGYYPCPAGPRYALGAADHGKELRFVSPDTPPDAAIIPPGPARLGRCKAGPGGQAAQPLLGVPSGVSGAVRVDGFRVDSGTGTFVNIAPPGAPNATNNIKNPDGSPVGDRTVFIGDIPYVTINETFENNPSVSGLKPLPLSKTVDAFGQKFIYAVSAPMTHIDTYDLEKPNITVRKLNYRFTTLADQTVANANRSTPYLIVSSGADRLGTRNVQGLSPNAALCAGAVAGTNQFSRRENCNSDAIFLMTMGTNANLSYTTAAATAANNFAGAKYFDDILSYNAYTESAFWEKTKDSPSDMNNSNSGNVGIGREPNALFKLDVQGKSRADKLVSQEICSQDAVVGAVFTPEGNCFDPRVITGDPDAGTGGMKCPADMVLTKIGSGTLAADLPADAQIFTVTLPPPAGTTVKYACVKPTLNAASVASKTCPVGRWVIGFKSNGDVCCNGDTCN